MTEQEIEQGATQIQNALKKTFMQTLSELKMKYPTGTAKDGTAMVVAGLASFSTVGLASIMAAFSSDSQQRLLQIFIEQMYTNLPEAIQDMQKISARAKA